MSNNIAQLMVGLGYDLSALEKGAPEAFRMINQQTLGMSAEMKRNAREGAEAFRSIDEMIGIHINRPMTRLLVETFPSFGKALSDVLGGVAFGAVAFAGFELFDRISKQIEKARAAQEKYVETSKAFDETIGNVLGGIDKKILEATSEDRTVHIRLEGAEQAKAGIDQISKSLEEMQKAEEKAHGFWTRLWGGTGDFLSHLGEGLVDAADLLNMMNSGAKSPVLHDAIYGTQAFNNMKVTLTDMKDAFDEALGTDKWKGTHEALQLAQKDIEIATAYLHDMQAAGDKAGISLAQNALKFYQSSLDVEKGTAKLQGIQQSKETAAALASFYKEIGDAGTKFSPVTDPIVKLEGELDAARGKAIADFDAMRESGATAVQLDHALTQLRTFEAELDRTRATAIATADAVRARSGADTAFAAALAGRSALAPALPQFASPTSPTLGAGGSLAQQLDAFRQDALAQNELIAKAFQAAITPEQQAEFEIQKLTIAFDGLDPSIRNSAQAQQAFAAAVQKVRDEVVTSETRIQGMERALERLLETSNTVGAGIKAFYMQLQIEASDTAKFTFDFMSSGMKGLEDTFVRSLNVMGANHRERMLEMRRLWNEFFISIDEKLLQFSMNKMFATLLEGAGHTAFGKEIGSFLTQGSDITKGAAPTQMTAATVMQTAASEQLIAAQTMLASSTAGSVGSPSAIANPAGLLGMIPGFASGTEFAPGGMSLVGENGPELVNLPAGSSVTPNQMLRAGASPAVHVNIDARGAQEGVAEQIARSWQQNGPAMVTRAVVEAYERQRRSLSTSTS